MKPLPSIAIAIVTCCVASTAAEAQWVSFSDDTGTRLSLQPFIDNPTGNPMQDAEEKDVAVADLDQDGDDDVDRRAQESPSPTPAPDRTSS